MKWSYSSHNAMRRCQLQFVFGQVIASHNARDPERHETYLLKQLQRLPAWRGSVVHKVLATVFLDDLRHGREISEVALYRAAQELARKRLTFSQAGKYRQPGMTKARAGDGYSALWEHEQGRATTSADLAELDGVLAACFGNLLSQAELLRELRSGYGHRAEPPLSFLLDGVSVKAVPDLLLLQSDVELTIVDWKVGESGGGDYSRQLALYGLAATRCGWWPGLRAEDIRLYEVNLLKNSVIEHRIGTDVVEEAEDFVYGSIVEMRGLLEGARAEDLDLSDYDVARSPGTCALCNFRSMCAARLELPEAHPVAEPIQGRMF